MSDEMLMERLYDLLKEAAELVESPITEPLHPDLFLPDYLDSIGLTTLLTLIEEEWQVTFGDDELGPEMFESPATLTAALVARLPSRDAH